MVASGAMTSYMSRIYLAPRSVQPEDGTELWINFGWNTKGNVRFPEWSPVLNSVCSKDSYDRLAKRMSDYVDANGLNLCIAKSYSTGCLAVAVAGSLLGVGFPDLGASILGNSAFLMPVLGLAPSAVCCVVGCAGAKLKSEQMTAGMSGIVQEAGWRGLHAPRLQLIQRASHVAESPEFMGIDQYGTPLKVSTGGSDHHRYGPVWPPLGYNLVVTLPKAEGDALNWPGTQAAATGVTSTVIAQPVIAQPMKPGMLARTLTGSGFSIGGASSVKRCPKNTKTEYNSES